MSVSSASNDTSEFNCRLCRLKCNNERSLHDHVARVHGGKGPLNAATTSTSSSSKNNDDAVDADYAEDGDDYEDDADADADAEFNDNESDEAHSGSGSDLLAARHQQQQQQQQQRQTMLSQHRHRAGRYWPPKPNVAIRVAKAAYYNSKGTSHAANAFKAHAMFTSGGMRGNFFSQERLPLRSCKIRIKLSNEDIQQGPSEEEKALQEQEEEEDEDGDLFLAYSTEVSACVTIDRNTTETRQVTRKCESRVPPSHADIRSFFRSLVAYIPSACDETPRLDELIKSNGSRLAEIDALATSVVAAGQLRCVLELKYNVNESDPITFFFINTSLGLTNSQNAFNSQI